MSNRVEELESKVKELQAAVNGLTEELVETKERVRQLEDEVDVDLSPAGHRRGAEEGSTDETDEQVEGDKADGADEGNNEGKSSESDIIVA